MGKPAVYLRVSSPDQRERQSIQSQEAVVRPWLVAQDTDPESGVYWYRDDGVSGKQAILGRGDGKRLAADIRAGIVSGYVAVYSISRLSRSAADYFTFRELLREHDVALIGVTEGIDTAQAGGDFAASIHAVLAEEAHRGLMQASKAGHERAARNGRWQGDTPYGYALDNGTLIEHPDHAPIARQMFDLYLEGIGATGIAARLNDAGIPSPRGVRWSSPTITRLLRNPAYMGQARYNKRRAIRQNGKVVGHAPRDESEHIVIECLPLVDLQTWERVQQRLVHRIKQYSPNGAAGRSLLVARLYCAECGARLYANAATPGRRNRSYYRHEHRFPEKHGHCTSVRHILAQEIDIPVWNDVVRAIANPDKWLQAQEQERAANSYERERAELKEIARAIAETGKAKERVDRMHGILGTLTEAEYTPLALELGARLERLQARQKEIRGRIEASAKRSEQERGLAERMRRMQVDATTPSRAIVDQLVDSVRVSGMAKRLRVDIEWRI